MLKTYTMQTIRLRVSNRIFKNLMWFLKRFNKDEIQVIQESDEFLSVQEYLKEELSKVEEGNAEFLSLDELEEDLDSTINKYED